MTAAAEGGARVVIAGGGTGGHLFPGIAVAEALRARGVSDLLFVSAGTGNWREILDRGGFRWRSLPVRGFGRRPGWAHLLFPFRLAIAFALAFWILVAFRPGAVVGTGGYVSGPVVAMAWLLGVPIVLLEQNAVPGVTTRLAARFAREIHMTYPGSEASLPSAARERARPTGNPIRAGLLAADPKAARASLGLSEGRPVLFTVGGSQGALAINRALYESLALPGASAPGSCDPGASAPGSWAADLQLVIQTGAKDQHDWDAVKGKVAALVARPFFHEIGEAYAAADVILCRAGATTLAEITALGKPAVLVPYPHAAADHQTHNAESMARAGAAVSVAERDLTPERLMREVSSIVQEPGRRAAMAAASRGLGKPEAADRVAESIVGLARGRGTLWSHSARS